MSIRLLRNPFKRRTVASSAPETQDDERLAKIQAERRMLRVVTNGLHASFVDERAHLMAELAQAKKNHEPTADLSRRLKAVNRKLMKFENEARRNG